MLNQSVMDKYNTEYVGLLLNMYINQLEDKTVKFIEDDIKNNIFI